MGEQSGQFSVINVFAVLGGLSVFLLGLEMMSANLRKVAGNTLKLILEKATDSPLIGVLVGTFVTALIQSSSATTSILISFVQSQLMTFERSIAVILGANIGTTITAQIVAFKITHWSLAIIAVGFLCKLIAKRTKTKNVCYVVLGLGFIFYGLEIMSTAMSVLRDCQFFLDLMQNLEQVGFGILFGAVFTALIQSSSASIGIVIGLAMQNLISIEAAVPIILGANIGTCVTACLASIGTSSAAKRVAAAHVLFNVGGVLLFAFWVPSFIDFLRYFTPDRDTPRLVANAQSSFNIIATIVWFPFIKQLEYLARTLVPEDKNPQRLKYVFPRVNSVSRSADILLIHSVEAIKNYKNVVKEMLWLSRDYFTKENQGKDQLEAISKLREYQKELRSDLLDFLSRIVKLRLSLSDVSKVLHQITLVNEIEHIAYKLETAMESLHEKLPQFDASYLNLEDYFKQSVKCFSKSCNAVLRDSKPESKRIFEHLSSLKIIEEDLRNRSTDAVREDQSHEDYETEKLNLWVLEFLRSVNSTSRRISQILLD